MPTLLTPKEMQVLRLLMASPGQVVKRDQLLTEIWNERDSSSNIVDVYIRRLRMKLEEDADRPTHIISVRGIGYKFVAQHTQNESEKHTGHTLHPSARKGTQEETDDVL